MRKKLTATITALAMALTVFAVPVSAAGGNNWMERVGPASKSVKVGQEFELEVNHGKGLNDNQIKWTIGNTSIVKLADDDRYDDEVEFKAVKKGTTKITANNLETGGKLVYTITVKPKSQKFYIYRVGDKNRSVKAGQEFELRVTRTSGMKENDIKWTSSNTNVVKYDDDDRYDNEMEFRAVKAGKATITAKNLTTGGKIQYIVTVKENSGDIYMYRVGSATKYVEADDDLELKVNKGAGLNNNQIKWTVSNSNMIWFEDGDNYGREVELETGHKTGTVTVTAHNLKTGGKIVYTVKITPEYDD